MQKGQTHTVRYAVGTQYTVGIQYAVGTHYALGTQYAVGFSAKRSTHTVYLANMGGGDHYLKSKKVKPVGVSRGYTDYHQGRAIHMADSRVH